MTYAVPQYEMLQFHAYWHVTNAQTARKDTVKFADKMKEIQLKQQEAAGRPKPLAAPLGVFGGKGSNGKGFGAPKGKKQRAGK